MSYALHWMRYKTCLFSSENRVCGDQSPHIPARKVIIRPAPRNDSAPIPGNLSISSRVKRGCIFPRKGSSSPVKSYQSKRADSKIASEGENDTEPATFSVATKNNSLLSGTATKSAQQFTGTPYIPILQVDGGLRVTQLTFDGYGTFGGQFAPESIMGFLSEVTFCFQATVSDPGFWSEYARFRPAPTSLHVASNLTSLAKGATIWLKREDQNDYGSHKARNITGQLLLAKRMGRQEVVTDCASAKHGSFTAAMCARLGLRCVIVMGTDDAQAQSNDVAEIKALGAKVLTTCTPSGMGSLRAAITEALRYAVCHHESAYYLMGSPVGPSPLPTITRTFQSILGEEVMHEMHAQGIHPDALVVAIGGGSGAVGLFRPFLQDVSVRLVGVEAAQAAPLATGELGVLHGARTLMLQSPEGQITDSHSISPDMNLSTVGPEVAYWKNSERIEVSTATDEDAIHGFEVLRDQECILSGLDSSHAVRKTLDLANSLGPGKNVVLMVTGRDNIAMRGTIL
ncbi:unnamed protein product [Penicillium olsonii]|uniref:tryptophan synthase n=1 Tax=Penicillium olsonii TaxID=99116 RepID=A0A9W4I3J3_PENOL|nr:unnamed protein product [Penicillium olsonii]